MIYFANLASEIYVLAIKAFIVRTEDVKTLQGSAMNFVTDVQDFMRNQTIQDVRCKMSEVVENYGSFVDSSLTQFVSLSLFSVIKNIGIPDNYGLLETIEKLNLSKFVVVGEDDFQKMSSVCGSLAILSALSAATPTRKDLL